MLKYTRITLPIVAGLLLLFVGIFLAGQHGWYYQLAHLDTAMHFTGGIIAAWFVWAIFAKKTWHIIGIAIAIGLVWELAEYVSRFTRDVLPLWYHYFHGGNLADTITDLVADFSGSILLTAWVLRRRR